MWFGLPGQLVELPDPEPDISGPLGVRDAMVTSLGGAVTVQRFSSSKRTVSIKWDWLTEDQASILTAYYLGQMGRGPYVLITDIDTNMLTGNQASASDVDLDTSGFYLDPAQGTLVSTGVSVSQGSRCLRWSFPSVFVGGSKVSLAGTGTAERSPFELPVIAGKVYTFTANVSGSSSSIKLQGVIEWYTLDETFLGESSWQTVAMVGAISSYTTIQVTGSAPIGAVFCSLHIRATNGVNFGTVSIDKLQFEKSNQPSNWKPGMGAFKFMISDLGREYPLGGWHSHGTVTFTEVG